MRQYDLKLVQLDMKTAFLHDDLKEEISMSQLDGFQDCQKIKQGLQIKKIVVWIEAIFEVVVQEI